MADRLEMKLFLQRMGFLKTVEKLMLMDLFKSPQDIPEKNELSEILGRRIKGDYSRQALLDATRNDLSLMLNLGVSVISLDSDQYPCLLREIHNPPFILYCRGAIPVSDGTNVSVVGTRKATGEARQRAFGFSFDLARSGASVISGLAAGIDAEAHKGALAGNGYTMAVLGCGIDQIYPAANKELAAAILGKGGSILSEYPPGTPPLKYNFPERNRIVSAMSEATVIVESPQKSGALITAEFALEQGRDVFVLNTSTPSQSAGAGTEKLVFEGAQTVDSASDVLEELSYRRNERSGGFEIDPSSSSEKTGIFLAERFMAELEEMEVNREGVYYRV